MADANVETIETPAAPESPFTKADPKLNPRNQAFAEIAARANARQDANAAEPMPPKDGEAPPVLEDETEISSEEAARQADAASEAIDKAAVPPPATPSEPVAAAASATPSAPPIDPNADYDITVDGKPLKVKGAKIIEAGFRTFQKETAADYRLQLATTMLEQARQTVAQAQPQKPAAPQAPEVNDLQLAELIQFGTKEQAAEAVKLLRQQNPATVTQDGLRDFMMTQIPSIVNSQLMFQRAADFAKTEYGDLLSDPYLKDVFLMKEEQLRKAGDQRPPADLYKAIGEDLRKHFNRPKAPTAAPGNGMQARQDAKRAAPAAPKLASARLSGGEPQRPKTREQIIDQMRQARGQSSLNRT